MSLSNTPYVESPRNHAILGFINEITNSHFPIMRKRPVGFECDLRLSGGFAVTINGSTEDECTDKVFRYYWELMQFTLKRYQGFWGRVLCFFERARHEHLVAKCWKIRKFAAFYRISLPS